MRGLFVAIIVCALTASVAAEALPAQQQAKDAASDANRVVVMSDNSSTVRVADPNELIGVNGRVMRIADYLAALFSNTVLVQHLRNLEKQTPANSPQAVPPQKTH